MRTRSLLPAAVLLCGCGLRHRTMVPEPARGPARDSLFRVDLSRNDSATARGAVDGLVGIFAADVAYLRAGAPIAYGRAAARATAALSRATQSSAVTWEPLGGGVSDDLRAGYTYGVAARAGTGTPTVRLERYIAYWERGRAQPWRIVAYSEVGGESVLAAGDVPAAVPPPAAPPLPKALDEARAAVRAADSLFSDLSYRMGAGYAFANTIADAGVLFGSPPLLVGPRAVREFYDARGDSASLTWKPVLAGVAASRDLGFTVGQYIATGRGPSGAAVQRFGKYLTVWKRQKDGSWRFLVDGGSPSPTPPSIEK